MQLFWKSWFCAVIPALTKDLFCRYLYSKQFLSNSSAKKVAASTKELFCRYLYSKQFLSNSSAKKVAAPKSKCPKELAILKKWLFGRSFAPKSLVLGKYNWCKEMNHLKLSSLKKQLLWKNSCSERVTFVSKQLL